MSSVMKLNVANGSAVENCIVAELEKYFQALGNEQASGVHRMVMQQAERAVIQCVMDHVQGNQSHASEVLGISRGTLRRKLRELGIEL